MMAQATAPAVAASPSSGTVAAQPSPAAWPAAAHGLAASWILLMVALALTAPERYEALLQEDRWIEWWTVTLFAGAGFFALQRGWRERRPFDALVGAFCMFVAGEEFSWGQRLLGFTPPAPFLEHNVQQEFTLHNFAELFGQPKSVLILALAGFGLLLPLLSLHGWGRALLERAGASVPRTAAVPWFIAAVALLVTYPFSYTGEWTESLAGGLFLMTFAPRAALAARTAAIGSIIALVLAAWSGRSSASAAEVACAQAEAQAIAEDLAYGSAATGRLAGARSVHKRVFTSIQERYIDAEALKQFREVSCGSAAETTERRRHAIDPWGTAYWLSMQRSDASITLRVYSFGPNRRRDDGPVRGDGDDVGATIIVRP